MSEATISPASPWRSPSSDPNDETFGDVVESVSLDDVDGIDVTGASADRVDADGFDALILGEPYDGAVIGRRGAREGPAAIREALAGIKTHHLEAGSVGSIGDLGDLAWPTDRVSLDDRADVAAVQSLAESVTAAVHDLDAIPVFLGGDNSLTVPNVSPLLETGSVGVLNFDAHLDVREPTDGPTSGTPYRQLLEDGLDAYAVVGGRHFETSRSYVAWLEERGGIVVTPAEVADRAKATLERLWRRFSGVEHLYVSVDVDVLDAATAPGVSAPTPGGLTARELFGLVRTACGDPRLAGVEVVECAPGLETGDRTARVAARTVAHALAGYGAGAATRGGGSGSRHGGGRRV